MDTFDADDYRNAAKPLPASLTSVFGISGQFEFTEYQTPPNATTTYQINLNNFDTSENAIFSLFGDGSVVVQVGDTVSIPTYFGTWTPNGGTHVVHFSIDGAGVPTLFVDGITIPLVFVANTPSAATLYPNNSITYAGGAGDVTPASSPLFNLFITAGATAPDTEFCCV